VVPLFLRTTYSPLTLVFVAVSDPGASYRIVPNWTALAASAGTAVTAMATAQPAEARRVRANMKGLPVGRALPCRSAKPTAYG
jgi:3-hydroxyisobutyrate dehydrogenase-like beta-hydroxyacid dehydrogenase